MGLSWWHILLVLLVGAGKISGLMGDLAKGIKSFKKEMAEGDGEPAPAPQPEPAPKVIEHNTRPAGKSKTAPRAKTPRTPKAG